MFSQGNIRHFIYFINNGCKFSTDTNAFKFTKVLLVYKMSKLEIEQYRQPKLTPRQLEHDLRERGADFPTMVKSDEINKKFQKRVRSCFEKLGLETKVVNRFNYSQSCINWCDVVFPVGGDGTFLFAASRILGNTKAVIGFNSDPGRSEGHLCLPKKYSDDIELAIRKICQGHFRWMDRTRIRVTFSGNIPLQSPVELHEPSVCLKMSDSSHEQRKGFIRSNTFKRGQMFQGPFLALNEVFLGEVLTAKVSYFEMRINGCKKGVKVKSSGLCVCTGTGSTSWSMSINRLNREDIRDIIQFYNKETNQSNITTIDEKIINSVCNNYNRRFVFSPEEQKMAYTIRDLISVGVWPYPKGVIEPKSFADKIEVRSKCTDAGLVLDGGAIFPFNEGTITHLEIHSEDALKTIEMLSEYIGPPTSIRLRENSLEQGTPPVSPVVIAESFGGTLTWCDQPRDHHMTPC